MLLNTFPSQQLSVVSHARMLLSIINCSNKDFFSFQSSRNCRNRLLLHAVEYLIRLMLWGRDLVRGLSRLRETASSLGSEGKVLICSHTVQWIHSSQPLSGFHPTCSYTFRTSVDLFVQFWQFVGNLWKGNLHKLLVGQPSIKKFSKPGFPLARAHVFVQKYISSFLAADKGFRFEAVIV